MGFRHLPVTAISPLLAKGRLATIVPATGEDGELAESSWPKTVQQDEIE
jgi:hypothetical protein